MDISHTFIISLLIHATSFLIYYIRKVRSVSHSAASQLFAIQWTVALQAPLSMEFSRQEYWSGCHLLLQGIFLTQGSKVGLLHCRQIVYGLSHQGSPSEHLCKISNIPSILLMKFREVKKLAQVCQISS